MSDGGLAGVPLFAGISPDELSAFAEAMRLVDIPKGEEVWREGDKADDLYVILSGGVTVLGQLPSERELEVAILGPGAVLGEVPLLGGGTRSATVRAAEDSRFLALGRTAFVALLGRGTPGALAVRQRLLALVCERLRGRHAALADWLGGGRPPAEHAPPDLASGAPALEVDHVLRLPFFREFDRSAALDVLARGTCIELPRAQTVLQEGAKTNGCWITLEGAVEELIRRGSEVIRVGLAGPGYAFGYVGLIDGLASSLTVATRERSRLLHLAPGAFEILFDPASLGATAFREAIERDLVRALRVSLRPQARLEASSTR